MQFVYVRASPRLLGDVTNEPSQPGAAGLQSRKHAIELNGWEAGKGFIPTIGEEDDIVESQMRCARWSTRGGFFIMAFACR